MSAAREIIRAPLPSDIPLAAATKSAWEALTGETLEFSGSVVSTHRLLRASVKLGPSSVSAIFPDTVINRIATDLLSVDADIPLLHTMTLDFAGELVNLIAGIIGDELAQRGLDTPLSIPVSSLFGRTLKIEEIRTIHRFHSARFGPFWIGLED